jgi:hypothetical protein
MSSKLFSSQRPKPKHKGKEKREDKKNDRSGEVVLYEGERWGENEYLNNHERTTHGNVGTRSETATHFKDKKSDKKKQYRCACTPGYCHFFSCKEFVDRLNKRCPACQRPNLFRRQAISFPFADDGCSVLAC